MSTPGAPAPSASSGPAPGTAVLGKLQRGLEALYRVETQLDVEAFMVGEDQREEALGRDRPTRRPREQLLVSQEGEDLSLGLFLDREALMNLERNDPSGGLCEANFWDFCLAVEGVSHFIYVARCAAADRAVSVLELELQAEVDKFVSCAFLQDPSERDTRDLRERLYEDVRLASDLDEHERDRYRTANDQARRYADSLDRRFIGTGRVIAMLGELRRFYRWDLSAKLHHIAAS